MERVAKKAEPTDAVLRERIRSEPTVRPDETGWKVGGQRGWRGAFSSPGMTVYAIQPGRGFQQAAAVRGEGLAGFRVRDGGSVYRQFAPAVPQTCWAHRLRRCREMIPVAGTPGAPFPCAIQTRLQSALHLRRRRDQEQIRPHGLAMAGGRGEARLDRVWQRCVRSPAYRRWANHLLRERETIFTLRYGPGWEAPNGRAGRTSHPSHGGHAHGLGRQPHRERSPDTKRVAQPLANLPPAEPACAPAAQAPTLFPSTTRVGFDHSTPIGTLNKYLQVWLAPRPELES